MLVFRFLSIRLQRLPVQNGFHIQGIGTALSALKAADTVAAIGCLLRMAAVFAETVTVFAVGALVDIEFEKDQGEPIE